MELKELLDKHYQDITFYKPRIISQQRKPIYVQSASNCWLYAMCNNLYLNTELVSDANQLEKRVDAMWKNSQTWWRPLLWWLALCEQIPWIKVYSVDLRKKVRWKYINKEKYVDWDFDSRKIKLLTSLWKNWYALQYSRTHWKSLTKDIREDDVVDNILNMEDSRHATNLKFVLMKLREYWTRWDNSRYNEFNYKDTDIFIKSIKNWTIRPTLLFMDYYAK